MINRAIHRTLDRWKTTSLLLTTALLCGVTQTHAQVVPPSADQLAELDRRVRAHLADNNIPGGLVAVVSRGRMVHLETYGMANVELAVAVTDSTVFEIGSISKQFVAAAVMLLVQEDRIGLDDPIDQYLPYLPSEWLGVTVRQLLTHTSGIPDYEEIRTYDVYRFRLTPEEVIQIAHSRPMDFAPGTGWYYSNTGYFLLSMIVERIEGRPLGRVLHDRIFGPLGMTQTRMADPEAIIPHRASGYWVDRTGALINRNPTETSSTLGAGGLLSSVHDLAKWDDALYGAQLLSAESKATMWTPAVLPDGRDTGYAFGWSVRPYRGLRSQSHSGQVAGFVANFARFPDQEIAVIVFLNRYRVSSGRVRVAVLHTFMPSLGPIP
jgi:CubicO group peptidase (beta-lactamase class C family)